MTTISLTEFQKKPNAILKRLDEMHEPIRITRRGKNPLILLPENDLPGWKETLYLLSDPENARRLREAVDRFHNNKREFVERELIEIDE